MSEADWVGLQPEVTEWEPREALLAGADGLDALRATIPQIAVAPAVGLEVGEGQAAVVAQLLPEAGCPSVEARPDLAGIERT